jgi:hypothetical protein
MSGRVIVVGDVHGCADEVKDLFAALSLTPKDRVIFVGDLIHRGPKDRECVEIAMQHESLQGNHESWALGQRQKPLEQIKPHHRQAHDALTEEQWKWLATRPLYIDLPEYNAWVVHAGVVPDRPIQCQDPKHLLHLQCCRPPAWKSYWPSECPTSEERFWTHWWKGPQRVIFGHSHLTKPLILPYAVGIDCGCVHGRFLTAVILPGWEIVQVPARATYYGNDKHRHGERIKVYPITDDVGTYSG